MPKASSTAFAGFSPKTVAFLRGLEANNNRDWFQRNKARYESDVREPALDFIAAMGTALKRCAPHLEAVPKAVGGSLMRVHRDTRFAKDKRPYKTNVGIHFRHEVGKDVHAPGLYFHIDPERVFLGAGLWHPEAEVLAKIRGSIVDDGAAWKRARDDKRFRGVWEIDGESLSRPPRGFDKDHPYVEDLKRKDFIAVMDLRFKDIQGKDVVARVTEACAAATPWMRFLCRACELPY
ncbi:MAG: DUF2461 domain-containing protein [Deltaproteobacteria bacterium]|nr:DUF2461 domain-containing protein [Deltaproteobacteria bacterium]